LLVGLITLVAWALSSGAQEAPPDNVGLARFSVDNPVGGAAIATVAWYPTKTAPVPMLFGPYRIEVAIDAAPIPGRYPLIILSHGTGGSAFNHHDTVTHLVQKGFVTVTLMHPGDNFQDTSAFGTDVQLLGRPGHVVAVLDATLKHAALTPIVDPARIGMVGFSAGAYTALVLAGGRPDLDKVVAYATRHPADAARLGRISGGLRRTLPDQKVAHDPRIKAAVLLAPALGFAFDQSDLAAVKVPIRLYQAEADEVLPHVANADRIRQLLPRPPEFVVLPAAGHYVFLAPCPEALAAHASMICADPPGVDRRALHERVNSEIVEFFRRTLR